jgi:hypothetical protein
MGKRIVVTPGERYGKLVIVSDVEQAKGEKRLVLCKCDCGNTKIIPLRHLRYGVTKSCGCLKKGAVNNHGVANYKSRLYKIWDDMKQRTENPKNKRYEIYGERGIKICSEWRYDFPAFKEWALNNGYSDTLTIDRIDANRGYEPSNCRWVTLKVQANNRRNNVLITYHGVTHTISEWSDITGIRYCNIKDRYRRGLPLEQVFFYGHLRDYPVSS